MYHGLALFTGVLITVMIAVNGGLTARYGVYTAAVIMHVLGLVLISAVSVVKGDRLFLKGRPWLLYMGGAVGVFTAVANNFAFGLISVSAILALGLLGQSVAGIVVDHYGLLGMAQHPFARRKLVGLAVILAGICVMITSFQWSAVLLSFGAGISIVVSRTLNARLSAISNVRVGTFFNYLVGLTGAVLVFAILGGNESTPALTMSPSWYIYLGGVIGVGVILLGNITVVKVSAFYLTLLIFVGQVFSGVLVDALIFQETSVRNMLGGGLVTVGLTVDLLLEKYKYF